MKLKATSDDMDALHSAANKKGKIAKVDKEALNRVLNDHALLLQRLGNQVQ